MSTDQVWYEYVTNNFNRFISTVEKAEWKVDTIPALDIEIIRGETPKSAYNYLREFMYDSAIKRLQNRYRAHKHREKTGLRNIQIKEEYLVMLDKFKDMVGAESYEEAFDFLLSPDYLDYKNDVENAKILVGDSKYTSDELYISSFISRLTKYDRERIAFAIEKTHYSAWESAKNSRKRRGDPEREALKNFSLYQNIIEQL